jgi:hypothetical protein
MISPAPPRYFGVVSQSRRARRLLSPPAPPGLCGVGSDDGRALANKENITAGSGATLARRGLGSDQDAAIDAALR